MRDEIIRKIETEKIITIVRNVDKEKLIPLAEALYKGGIRLMEITYDAKGIISDDKTAENIAMLANHFEGKMCIGAGTVLTKTQVELTKKAGGGFIISPDTFCDVIYKTRELDMVSIPGALTPTEILNAHRYGADFVKLFPIVNLGAEYVKAIKAPLSHIKMLGVGGIDENNMKTYITSGIEGIGIGSNIVNKKMIAENNFDKITELAEIFCEGVKK